MGGLCHRHQPPCDSAVQPALQFLEQSASLALAKELKEQSALRPPAPADPGCREVGLRAAVCWREGGLLHLSSYRNGLGYCGLNESNGAAGACANPDVIPAPASGFAARSSQAPSTIFPCLAPLGIDWADTNLSLLALGQVAAGSSPPQ